MDLTLERKNTVAHARKIVDTATAENRDLTAAELASVEADHAHVKELDKQIKGRELVNSVMALGRVDGERPNPDVRGTGWFSEEAKAGIVRAIKTRTSYRAEVPTKAALTTNTVLPPTGGYVEGGLHPNSEFPLASLFRNEAASGPVQRYYRMTSGTAAVVAEGALKPDSGVSFAEVDLPISKIACTAQFTTEMSDDAPFLVGWLQQELAAAVAAAENASILSTFDGTSGVLTGTGLTADAIDLVADAIAGQEAIHGRTPVAVIANPSVVAVLRKAKASTEEYLLNPLSTEPSMIHGVRLISSPATAAGVAWVVDAAGVLIYRRSNLSVEVGTNADDLVKNTKTAVAEERMATAVTRPSALTKLTLT